VIGIAEGVGIAVVFGIVVVSEIVLVIGIADLAEIAGEVGTGLECHLVYLRQID